MKTPRCLGRLLPLLLLAAPISAQEGGIAVFAATTLFDQGTRVSLSHLYERKESLHRGSSEISDPQDRSQTSQRLVVGIDHGVRADLTLSALIPVVRTEFESGTQDLTGAGFGDVALLAKYRAYKRDWRRGSFNFAIIGGVELPTGVTTASEAGVRLPPSLQPGSGSLDPFLALSTNLNLNRHRYDLTALYKLNTEGARDYKDGDFASVEAAWKYRFYHAKYPRPSANVRLGLQWLHRSRSELDGTTVANTGSDELRLRTGLGWHPAPNIDLSLMVGIPVYQDFTGEQLGTDFRTILAFGFRF